MAEYKPWETPDEKIEDVVGKHKKVDASEAMNALYGIREQMGKYLKKGDALKISAYTPNKKANEKHEEGDVWEERDKLWTIKNGIKQTVTKMDGAKRPWFCPECGKTMRGKADDKMWLRRGKCHICVIKEETQMRIDGTYKKYEQEKVRANAIAWLRDKIDELSAWSSELSNPKNVLIDGRIEELDIGVAEARITIEKEIERMRSVLEAWEKDTYEVIDNMEKF